HWACLIDRDGEVLASAPVRNREAELVHRETFGTTRELRAKLSDYVHWYNNFRIHSTLGYMSPVEFREAGLSLPESSK
ncbi:IS3 family transposase, partial [Collinsella aerofaciens]|uniref:IS3 family transposase n=1 Tax=Collinsella aerofaciens TaxID=74426 RepID=UPI00233047F7